MSLNIRPIYPTAYFVSLLVCRKGNLDIQKTNSGFSTSNMLLLQVSPWRFSLPWWYGRWHLHPLFLGLKTSGLSL